MRKLWSSIQLQEDKLLFSSILSRNDSLHYIYVDLFFTWSGDISINSQQTGISTRTYLSFFQQSIHLYINSTRTSGPTCKVLQKLAKFKPIMFILTESRHHSYLSVGSNSPFSNSRGLHSANRHFMIYVCLHLATSSQNWKWLIHQRDHLTKVQASPHRHPAIRRNYLFINSQLAL